MENLERDYYEELLQKGIGYIRSERHQFINDLQVLYTLIQLDKKERAIEYLNEVSSFFRNSAALFKEFSPSLAIWLGETVLEGRQQGKSFSFQIQGEWREKNLSSDHEIRIFWEEIISLAKGDNITVVAVQEGNDYFLFFNGMELDKAVCEKKFTFRDISFIGENLRVKI